METGADPAGGQSAQDVGRIGERIAGAHLAAQGYGIVARNYRCRWGEVDLVARDGSDWVFVEVRARRSAAYGAPEESITAAKLERLALTAQDYLGKHAPSPDSAQWRIDLVAIRLGPGRRVQSIRHLPNIGAG